MHERRKGFGMDGDYSLVFRHHGKYLIVNLLRSVHCPDEVQVVVGKDLLMVQEAREFGKQHGDILGISQDVIATVPHCNWYSHG